MPGRQGAQSEGEMRGWRGTLSQGQRVPLEAGEGQETDSPGSLQRSQPIDTSISAPTPIQNFSLQNYKKTTSAASSR